jgi:hypothetical protein
MRKVLAGFLLFWTTGTLFIEITNSFRETKILYTLMNYEKYYFKDELILTKWDEITITKGGSRIFVYYGNLKKSNLDISFGAATKTDDFDFLNHEGETPVWYSKFADKLFMRRTENFKYPFTYNFEKVLFPILFIPSLFLFLTFYYPNRKILLFRMTVGYFLLLIYGCVTDFEVLKQHMDYFQIVFVLNLYHVLPYKCHIHNLLYFHQHI